MAERPIAYKISMEFSEAEYDFINRMMKEDGAWDLKEMLIEALRERKGYMDMVRAGFKCIYEKLTPDGIRRFNSDDLILKDNIQRVGK